MQKSHRKSGKCHNVASFVIILLLFAHMQLPEKCCRCRCCIAIFPCCLGVIDDDKDRNYLIHSWGDPEFDPEAPELDNTDELGLSEDVEKTDLTEMEMDEVRNLFNHHGHVSYAIKCVCMISTLIMCVCVMSHDVSVNDHMCLLKI